MKGLQRAGGLAALLHAAAYVVGIILGLTVMFPLLEAGPDQYLKFLSENQALVYVWNLISYWGSASTLVIMVLALYERLKDRSPALAQTSAAFGLIWAGLIIASGNELVGSLWVLLLSVAALRTGQLNRALAILGVVLGVAGMLTIVPALFDTMVMVFGPGMIVWSIWLGIVLLRQKPAAARQAQTFVPHSGAASLSR